MDVDAIRATMPLVHERLYFNTGGIAPSPAAVTDTLVDEFNWISQHGPPLMVDRERYSGQITDARQRMADFCGVQVEDLCLTRGVADGVTTVLNGFDWKEGDELILTDEEHPSVKIPAERLTPAHGVQLKFLPVAGTAEAILERLRDLLTPRTRLLALSHVTTDTGTRLPARDIVQLAHERDVPVLYDAAQSLGQFPIDVPQIGADFYSLLVYKWLYGPYSAGALYIEKSWHDRLRVVPTSVNYSGTEGAQRFEFITVPWPYYMASAAAFDFLRTIGLENIEARATRLATELRNGLKRIPGLSIESPEEPGMSTGIVTFRVEGVEGGTISEGLRQRNIITRPTGLKFSGVRVSVTFFNIEEELEAVVKAVAEIVAAAK